MPTLATEIGKPHPINSDWKDYYIILEGIRLSGITNMWGAHPLLMTRMYQFHPSWDCQVQKCFPLIGL